MVITKTCDKKTDLKNLLADLGFSKDYSSLLLRKKENISINDKPYDKNYNLDCQDVVKIYIEDEKSDYSAVKKDIDVLFEDEYFIGLNKPKGLASIPTRAHYDDNLCGRLKYYFEKNNESSGIHILNRLDFETSGVVVFSKNRFIAHLVKSCDIEKVYVATAIGVFEQEHGFVNKPILKLDNNKKRVIDEKGKNAVTEYKVLSESINESKLEFILHTGRTHQIRLHMASIGHPLTGDSLYGDEKGTFDLTCKSIKFFFVLNGKDYSFSVLT
jgi:23S rRNA pseudouridine1911/1915/1917 synthase